MEVAALIEVADLWEENQEFLKQRLGRSDSTQFGARWVLMPHVPAPRFNHVSMVRLEPAQVPELLVESRRFFRRWGLPSACVLTTPATRPCDLADQLQALGYVVETNPVMIWNGRTRPEPNAQVLVSEVPEAETDLVFDLIRRTFFPEVSEDGAWHLRQGVTVSYEIGAVNLVARIGEEPVGVASLFCRGGMGGIYNMGTIPAYRGCGVATTLMTACLAAASRLGCRYVGLTPTPMGRPLYERLGFEEAYLERYLIQKI